MTIELTDTDVRTAFTRREEPIGLLATDAPALATACHAMARRFHRGGRLIAFGAGGSAADAAHVVVEFVHPVIIGKRALPALSLRGGSGGFRAELELFAEPEDIALAIAPDGGDAALADALAAARDRGLLTVALAGAPDGPLHRSSLDHALVVHSDDPRIVREGQVTTYHVLWELVHVFLDAPEVLA
ncbi:SIS domain-containing protein [Pseudonocardia yunnanensis]|uniref:SIS domain-containing protein n=1 Tax=Pseudonocardia yunnanensis TaxID=58107 RepID=A0ABW4F5X8_9PSEU